jgi:hypothetical protein
MKALRKWGLVVAGAVKVVKVGRRKDRRVARERAGRGGRGKRVIRVRKQQERQKESGWQDSRWMLQIQRAEAQRREPVPAMFCWMP